MSKSYTIIMMPRADDDLDDIARYIALDSPTNATRVVNRIRDAIAQLASLPFAHPGAPEGIVDGLQLRQKVVSRVFRILYAVDGREVVILHIRHASRERKFPTG